MACMCGDTACPSCGLAQNTLPERVRVARGIAYPGTIDHAGHLTWCFAPDAAERITNRVCTVIEHRDDGTVIVEVEPGLYARLDEEDCEQA